MFQCIISFCRCFPFSGLVVCFFCPKRCSGEPEIKIHHHLFPHNIAINFKKLNYQLLMYNADDDNELNQSTTGCESEKSDT